MSAPTIAPATGQPAPEPPRVRRRVIAMSIWAVAFVAGWVTIGLPTEPVYLFGWLWTATIAWRSHAPWRVHLGFVRDWAPVVVLLVAYNLSRGFADRTTPHVTELIVADDGSTDETPQVVEALADPRVHYIRRPNGGASAARNTGIEAARGDIVAFVDSDDEWLPRKLEVQLARLRECDPRTGVVYCRLRRYDDLTDREIYEKPPTRRGYEGDVFWRLLTGWHPATPRGASASHPRPGSARPPSIATSASCRRAGTGWSRSSASAASRCPSMTWMRASQPQAAMTVGARKSMSKRQRSGTTLTPVPPVTRPTDTVTPCV